MENTFINEYEVTFDRYYEWVLNPIAPQAQKIVKSHKISKIAGLVCGILLLLIALITWQLPYLIIGVIYTMYCIYAIVFKTKKLAVTQYNNILRTNKTKTWMRKIKFFDDHLIVCDNKQTVEYNYSEIENFTENDEYYHLWVDDRFIVRVRKDSFTLGESDKFKQFINQILSNDKSEQ